MKKLFYIQREIWSPVPSDLIGVGHRGTNSFSKLVFAVMFAILMCFSMGSPTVATGSEILSTLENKGVLALEKRHYQEALTAFSDGYQSAQNSGDQKWQAKFLFYSGLTEQRKAEVTKNIGQQQSLLGSAVNYYNQMLRLSPNSGAALNNLAKVYLSLGNVEEAKHSYQQAIELRDKRQWFYALNYSNLLKEKGETQIALKYAILAALKQPASLKAHHAVVTLCKESGNTIELIEYLYILMHRGAVNRAQLSALDALEEIQCHNKNCEKLIILISVTLSHQYYDPEPFFRTDIGKRLSFLKMMRPELEKPIQELEMLHHGETFKARNYPWWKNHSKFSAVDERRRPSMISSREAFRELSRSLANWYRRSKKPLSMKWAENYYLLAINFVDQRYADPKSFLDLADFYINTGQQERLKEIRYQYENRLFHGKGVDYRDVHGKKLKWKNIYEYHQALGFMYAHLKEWENPRVRYASAIFQLEHAIIAANNFNRYAAQREEIKPIEVSPQIYALLSHAYFETDRAERGTRVAVAAAENYLNEDNTDFATKALQFVQEQKEPMLVSRNLKKRYETVIRKLPQLKPISMNLAPPRTIKLTYPNMSGGDVRQLQQALQAHDIDVSTDGVFGPNSKKALKKFQIHKGLPASGELDSATRTTLNIE